MDILKAELHCHNEYSNSRLGELEPSYDCSITIPQQLEQCYKIGLDVLFVTNHNTLDGYSAVVEYKDNHKKLKNLQIYPAEEITTDTGAHVLAYGISETIKPRLTLEAILDEIKSQDAVSSAAHPFEVFSGIREKSSLCDMIEVFNSANIDIHSNVRAKQFADKHNMIQVGGSDSHLLSTLGRCVNTIDSENSLDVVLSAMKRGRIRIKNARYITDTEMIEHISYKIANSKDYINNYVAQVYPNSTRLFSLLYRMFESNPDSRLWTVFFKIAKYALRKISYKVNFKDCDPDILSVRNLTTMLKMVLF